MRKVILIIISVFLILGVLFFAQKNAEKSVKNFENSINTVSYDYKLKVNGFFERRGIDTKKLDDYAREIFKNKYILYQIVINSDRKALLAGCRQSFIQDSFKMLVKDFMDNPVSRRQNVKIERLGTIYKVSSILQNRYAFEIGFYDAMLQKDRKMTMQTSYVIAAIILLLDVLILSRRRKDITVDDESRYKDLMVNNIKLEEEVENLAILREVSLMVNSILDFDTMLQTVIKVIEGKFNVTDIVIYLACEDNTFKSRISKSGDSISFDEKEIKKLDISCFNDRVIISPLRVKGKLLGAIKISNKISQEPFRKPEKHLLDLLSNQIAIAVNNAMLYDMAITDGHTKIYNKRYFHHKLEEMVNYCKRYSNELSLLMIDIDYFKKINDGFGHQAGDFVLHELASLMKNFFRKTDSLFRYGGEEFAVILPGTAGGQAFQIAEKLREIVKNSQFKNNESLDINLTISIGVSVLTKDKDENGMIKNADDALYRSKNEGRDRTTLEIIN